MGKIVVGMSNCMGYFGDYNIAKVSEVLMLDEDMKMPTEDCALMISNPATALFFLKIARHHRAGGVVNTGANSIVGRMINHLFKENSIPIVNIVSSQLKADEIIKDGAENVLVFPSKDFDEQFRSLVDKLHIHLFFDCIGGDLFSKILDLSPMGSDIYPYGMLSEQREVKINMNSLFQRKRIEPLNVMDYLPAMSKHERRLMFQEILKLHDTIFKPHVFKTFDFKNIQDAFKLYEQNRKSDKSVDGKIILKCSC